MEEAADDPDLYRLWEVLKYCRVEDGKRILNAGHPLIIALCNVKNPVIQLDKISVRDPIIPMCYYIS